MQCNLNDDEKSTVQDHLPCPNSMNSPASHAFPASPLPSPNSRNEQIAKRHNDRLLAMDKMDKRNPSEAAAAAASGGSYEFPKTHQIAVPTTFVQADTSSFRELVQKLTGISDDTEEKLPITMPARYNNRGVGGGGGGGGGKQQQQAGEGIGMAGSACSKVGGMGIDVGPRKSAFKLHERRQSMRKLEIKLGLTSLRQSHPGTALSPSPRASSGEIRSPNVMDLPALVPSPVTPLGSDFFDNAYSYNPSTATTPNSSNNNAAAAPTYGPPTPTSETPLSAMSDEERAIAQKGFYLHPSPRHTPRGSEPELLPLFPLHSPKQSSS